jgi:NADPH:quinone reductase-like Zn-dependent oxidoreductase
MVMREFGPPEVLRLEDVPTPEPGPGEVLIAVRAVSVNRTLDCAVRAGQYAHKPELPHVLGVDPSGVVAALGPDVTERRVGDRVVTAPIIGFMPGGPRVLGVAVWGGYADYVKVPARITHLIPDGVDFAAATAVARHAPLAFAQLRDHGQLQPGQWVLIMGAAGGLGAAAVQVAKYLGANVIAAAGADQRVQAALDLGADAGVNYRGQDLTAEVMRITGGKGVNVVIENIGDPDLFPKALASLARGGRLVTAGGHGGGTVPLDVKRLYLNQLSIIGDPVEKPADYATGLNALAEGRYRPMIDEILPLSEAPAAHARVESRGGIGKVILDPTR